MLVSLRGTDSHVAWLDLLASAVTGITVFIAALAMSCKGLAEAQQDKCLGV